MTCVTRSPLMCYQVQAEREADKLQAASSQHGELNESQFASAASLSAFHLIANAFRRTFSVTNPSSSSITAPTMFVKTSLCTPTSVLLLFVLEPFLSSLSFKCLMWLSVSVTNARVDMFHTFRFVPFHQEAQTWRPTQTQAYVGGRAEFQLCWTRIIQREES